MTGTGSIVGPVRIRPPKEVLNAVRLMIFGAALNIVSIVIVLATLGNLHDRLRRAYPSYSAHRLTVLLTTEVVAGIAISLAFAVLGVVLAKKVRDGRQWSRIITWIVAGLSLLGVLRSLASTDTPLSRFASLVVGLIDMATIVLLVLEPSNRYFRAPALSDDPRP